MNDEQGGNGRLTEVIRRAIKIAGAVKTVETVRQRVPAGETVETVGARSAGGRAGDEPFQRFAANAG